GWARTPWATTARSARPWRARWQRARAGLWARTWPSPSPASRAPRGGAPTNPWGSCTGPSTPRGARRRGTWCSPARATRYSGSPPSRGSPPCPASWWAPEVSGRSAAVRSRVIDGGARQRNSTVDARRRRSTAALDGGARRSAAEALDELAVLRVQRQELRALTQLEVFEVEARRNRAAHQREVALGILRGIHQGPEDAAPRHPHLEPLARVEVRTEAEILPAAVGVDHEDGQRAPRVPVPALLAVEPVEGGALRGLEQEVDVRRGHPRPREGRGQVGQGDLRPEGLPEPAPFRVSLEPEAFDPVLGGPHPENLPETRKCSKPHGRRRAGRPLPRPDLRMRPLVPRGGASPRGLRSSAC